MIPAPEHTRAAFDALAGLIRKHHRFLLLTHDNPDGDALGSMLALGEGLKTLGKRVVMFHRGEAPDMYAFLPGLGRVASEPGRPEDHDLVLMLDCHELDRVGPEAAVMARATILAVMDHHLTRDNYPEHGLIDTGFSSTGEMVFHLLAALDVPLTPEMAVNLYVAVTTDTGMFAFDNTTPDALRMAAVLLENGVRPWDVFRNLYLGRSPGRLRLLGLVLRTVRFHYEGRLGVLRVTQDMLKEAEARIEDADGFVEYPRGVAGVELAMLVQEGANGRCKVSLRSLGRANAAALAHEFGGGGHFQAAGFSAEGTVDHVTDRAVRSAEKYLLPMEGSAA